MKETNYVIMTMQGTWREWWHTIPEHRFFHPQDQSRGCRVRECNRNSGWIELNYNKISNYSTCYFRYTKW